MRDLITELAHELSLAHRKNPCYQPKIMRPVLVKGPGASTLENGPELEAALAPDSSQLQCIVLARIEYA